MARRTFPTYEYGPTAQAPEVQRLYQTPVISMRIVRDSAVATPRQIKGPRDVYAALADRFADMDREVLVALPLDTKNYLLAIDPVSIGGLNSAHVSMRECFKSAMLLGAAAVIFAHNHPSGQADPSPEDAVITALMKQAGELLAIDVLDHVILGSNGTYVSMRERGLGFK